VAELFLAPFKKELGWEGAMHFSIRKARGSGRLRDCIVAATVEQRDDRSANCQEQGSGIRRSYAGRRSQTAESSFYADTLQ
jgi:hypothetical protein